MPRPNQPRTIGYEDRIRPRIKAERERRRWSLAAMAQAMTDQGCAVHPTAIWKVENGDRRITVNEAVAIAGAFGWSLEELWSDTIEALSEWERDLLSAETA